MKTKLVLLFVIILGTAPFVAFAAYSVANEGTWPESWPKELESLRKQAQTYVGSLLPQPHYLIPFTAQQDFEAAGPYFLRVKSKGAPIIPLRGPKTTFMQIKPAGVIIHAPAAGQNKNPATPEAPIPGVKNVRERWMYTTYIELVVDGQVVDLNRIPLPPDSPIIDQRFEQADK